MVFEQTHLLQFKDKRYHTRLLGEKEDLPETSIEQFTAVFPSKVKRAKLLHFNNPEIKMTS